MFEGWTWCIFLHEFEEDHQGEKGVIPKGTILPNLVHMTNLKGRKVAWVPLKQNNFFFVLASQ